MEYRYDPNGQPVGGQGHDSNGQPVGGQGYNQDPGTTQAQQTSYYQQPSGAWHYASQDPAQPTGEPGGGKRKSNGTVRTIVTGAISGVAGAAIVVGLLFGTGTITTAGTSGSSSSTTSNITINTSEEDTSVAKAVAAKCLPSVVSVYVTTSEGTGMGSGVILDTDGNILTNYHVIEDAQSITVTIEGETYNATVVGSDESSDIAVINAEVPDDVTLTPIEVGDSSALEVGDWVMTIGSPLGLEQSVSTGIVSALYRSTMLTSSSGNTIYTNLIQTDAGINQGNSGGALVNEQGQLVGINTMLVSETESFSGIGLAIPGNYAVEIANKIISGETITHAYLGVSVQTVNSGNSSALSVTSGAYVASVTEGGAADEAGIQAGDIVTELDGEEVTSADGLILAVRSHSVGDVVDVTVVRNGEELTLSVTLGSDEGVTTSSDDDSDSSGINSWEDFFEQFYGDSYGNSYGNSYGDQGYGMGQGYGRQ